MIFAARGFISIIPNKLKRVYAFARVCVPTDDKQSGMSAIGSITAHHDVFVPIALHLEFAFDFCSGINMRRTRAQPLRTCHIRVFQLIIITFKVFVRRHFIR